MSLRSQHDAVRAALAAAVALFVICFLLAAHYYSRSGARSQEEVSSRWRVLEARGWAAAGAPGAPLFGDPNLRAGEVLARADRATVAATDKMIHVAPLLGGALTLAVGAVILFFRTGGGRSGDEFLRGAQIVSSWRLRAQLLLARRLARSRRAALLTAGVPMPFLLENRHILLTGNPGSGKTQTARGYLSPLRARGDKVVLTDIKGDLMSSFARRGDAILNPLDARSVNWSPFAEVDGPWACDDLSKSIIPDGTGSAAEWNGYAQALVGAVLRRLVERGETANAKLMYWLTAAPAMPAPDNPSDINNLATLVAGLPAARLFAPGADRMLASVLAIVGTYLRSYTTLDPLAGADSFSVRRFVQDHNRGWLWLPYRADQVATLRPLLSCWLDLSIRAVTSLEPSEVRRVFLILDELPTLGAVTSLSQALNLGRGYGLSVIAGIQSVAQLREIYGREGATALLDGFGSVLVLRTSCPETADYLSKRLGEREVLRHDTSESGQGRSISERHVVERLVLASEIQNLPDRVGYMSLAGDYPVARVKVPVVQAPARIKPFVPRSTP